MELQENARLLLRYIHELSRGDTNEIIKRKNLGRPLGLSDKETKAALKELTDAGLIRYILFRSLAMTHIGVAEAEKLIEEEERTTRSAAVTGSGAVAQENGVAAGAGGVAVGGDVHGSVIIAPEGSQVTVETPGERRPSRVQTKVRESLGKQPQPKRLARRQPFEPEMVLIPAGEFVMGSDKLEESGVNSNEEPRHVVFLTDYYVARTPITNTQYAAFVSATDRMTPELWSDGRLPEGIENHPVVHVTWENANAYCDWLFRVTGTPYRLPTEAEWEKAARGDDGRVYPWGDAWDPKRCNTREGAIGGTSPVGACPGGASPFGLLDMAGNVFEWTSSLYKSYPYQADDGREDHSSKGVRVLRGGSFVFYAAYARCAHRYWNYPHWSGKDLGFRVAVTPLKNSG
jgi:formylglycine-generating enzyme required for sulfatase activity